MNRTFTLVFLFVCFAYSGCSKDFLKSYDERIIGTWQIKDIDRLGLGSNTHTLPFTGGTFIFHENGSLEYTNESNQPFKGSWEISKKTINDEVVRSLQLTAVDFTNQQVRTTYYDDITFTGTDRFKASSVTGRHTYITHFRR